MSERYQFDARDRALVEAAATLLKKVAFAEITTPAQLVSIAKLQHVLSALPRVTSGVEISVSVACPRRTFGDIETMHWWDVGVEQGRLSISSGGHYHHPQTGGDTFTTMNWEAVPEEGTELNDYRESLWMVPDVRSFPEAVASIDLAAGGYTLEITDEDNTLLEEDDQDEEDASVEDDEPGDEEESNENTESAWSITPIDDVEQRLASSVDADEVDANEPAYAYGVQKCDSCGCALSERGLFVDGRLRRDLKWGNMCAPCFATQGEAIGWGVGQLYARQCDGRWRMVAGWRTSDAGA